jgi:hypothetical protein
MPTQTLFAGGHNYFTGVLEQEAAVPLDCLAQHSSWAASAARI